MNSQIPRWQVGNRMEQTLLIHNRSAVAIVGELAIS